MANFKKYPRIIFFIAGSNPTPEEIEAAELLGMNVTLRNASLVSATGCMEACDGVAGAVPARYAKECNAAEDVLLEFQKTRPSKPATPVKETASQKKKREKAEKAAAELVAATAETGSEDKQPEAPTQPPGWAPQA